MVANLLNLQLLSIPHEASKMAQDGAFSARFREAFGGIEGS
jgi:hypothetical protein